VSELNCNRSRTCFLCGKSKHRVRIPAPKIDDPDYTVAVCPDCDMTSGYREFWRKVYAD